MTNDNNPKSDSPPVLPGPTWEFPSGEDHVDLINLSDDGRVFLFHWEPLDAEGFGTYGLRRMILLALGKLREDPRLKDRAFTVLAGDHGPTLSHLAIGYAPSDLDLARFFLKHWKKPYMDGPVRRDMSSLIPLYRYDHGHIIEYSEDRERGTVHVDGEDEYETGVTLHVRGFDLTDGKSKYGRLVER